MSNGAAKRLPEAISPRMAADLLGVSVTTIRRWIRKRHLLAYRFGTQMVRIPRSEIPRMRKFRIQYIESRSSTPPSYPRV